MNPKEYNRTVKNDVRFVKVPFDRETMWVEINHKLRKEKRRRIILFFFCFFSVGVMGTYFLFDHYFRSSASDTALISVIFTQIKGEKGDKIKTICDIKMEENVLDNRLPKAKEVNPISFASKSSVSIKSIESTQVQIEKEKMNQPIYESQSETKVQMAKTDHIEIEPMLLNPKILLQNSKKLTMQKPFSLSLLKENGAQKSILVFAGMGMVKRTLKPMGDINEPNELFQIRKDSEKVLEQISFGMDYAHVFKSNIFVTIGAEYRHITEKVLFDFKVREAFGNFSSFQTAKVTSYQYRYYNNLRFIDIRAGLGFKVNTKKVNVSLGAGISYSLYQSFDGVLLSGKERPKDIFTKSSNNNLFHLNANVTVDYTLNDQWSVSFSPFGSLGLNYFSLDNQPIGQKYDILKFRLGIKKEL